MSDFGQVLLGCHASLYRYARALARDPSLAEELVQETYQRALAAKRRPEIQIANHVRPWAFTILRNVWQNTLRQTRRGNPEEVADEEFAAPSGDSPEEMLIRKLLRSEIVQAIDGLPQSLREVIVLREIEGLSYADMASILECPQGTVMSRLARARQTLRTVLAGHSPASREVER